MKSKISFRKMPTYLLQVILSVEFLNGENFLLEYEANTPGVFLPTTINFKNVILDLIKNNTALLVPNFFDDSKHKG